MTQFTSFVAVEEMIVTDGGQPRRIDVPVEVPEGVNRAAVFGEENSQVGFGRGAATKNYAMVLSSPACSSASIRRRNIEAQSSCVRAVAVVEVLEVVWAVVAEGLRRHRSRVQW